MKTHLLFSIAAGALAFTWLPAATPEVTVTTTTTLPAPPKPAPPDQQLPKQKQIEVCFVLDTTGSMSGLIEGAKQKIWSIANDIISAKPKPKVRFGVIGYRDRGDEYVTKRIDLTDDMDLVYAKLREFRANGGGDAPESVSEALHEAVTAMQWSENEDTLKIIYLVGDAPPQHYQDGKDWRKVCKKSTKKDIVINAIQCGNMAGTAEAWKAIASNASGTYAVIPQDGNMQHISCPQDKELLELNIKIGRTMIPCGTPTLRSEVTAKQAAATAAPAPAAAARMSYNWKDGGKAVQGGGELLDDLAAGKKKLAEVKKDELPAELQKLSEGDLKVHVEKQQAERAALQKRVAELVKERDAYIATARKKEAASGKTDSFDNEVSTALREQAKKKGISFE